MAAAQNLSPGGALLRASRLFAVPSPLPVSNTFSGFGAGAGTRPLPTHLTVTTPKSSLNKGDWGLKRPLPLRSTTKTSTPLIRVTTMDTFEHVTEFESAADHTLTLNKWQEIQVSLSTPKLKANAIQNKARRQPTKSVFEEDIDYTAPRELGPNQSTVRWKYNGPWLAGQTELEFDEYLRKEVRRRRADFHHFLREEYLRDKGSNARKEARDEGRGMPEPLAVPGVTDEEFNVYLRKLRNDRPTLFRLIRDFLDLPPAPKVLIDDRVMESSAFADRLTRVVDEATSTTEASNPYTFSGPPKTHPSAGLSYLRTMAHIDNHPIFGPQETNAPIQGRVIMPRGAGVGSVTPKLGVAGVVVEVPMGLGGFNTGNVGRKKGVGFQREEDKPLAGLQQIDPDLPGGSKAWVKITGSHLDSDGNPNLWAGKASEMSVLVAQGRGEEAVNIRVPFAERTRAPLTRRSTGENNGYGLSGTGFMRPGVFGEKREPTKKDAQTMLKDFMSWKNDD